MNQYLMLTGVCVFLLYMSLTILFGDMAEKLWQARKRGPFPGFFAKDSEHDDYISMQKWAACIIIPFAIFFWISGICEINEKPISSDQNKSSVPANSDRVAPVR